MNSNNPILKYIHDLRHIVNQVEIIKGNKNYNIISTKWSIKNTKN